MGWLGSPHPKPSDQMLAVLTGKMKHDDAPAAIQSLCSKAYFDAAMQLIAINDRDARRKALTRIPDTCRQNVLEETQRLWPIRQQLLKSR